MSCGRCDYVPEISFNSGNVFVKLPTSHHHGIFQEKLLKEGYSCEFLEDGFFISKIELEMLCELLGNLFSNSMEKNDTKLLPLGDKKSLTYIDLKNYRSLSEWENLLQEKEVLEVIQKVRLKTMFQPIVDSITGDIYGYEALNRGIKSDGALIHPEQLFQKAKEMDMMFHLDRICREQSIRVAAKQGIKKKIFINFIPTAIYEPSLCLQTTEKTLQEVGLDPDQIIFEVVETEKVEDITHLNKILSYYKEKGYQTALDDMGSGFSDLTMLHSLKPDFMKLDMSLIRDIHENSKNQKIVKEYINQASLLGIKTLAEGIETKEEYQYLRSLNIYLMQGYYFGKPKEMIV